MNLNMEPIIDGSSSQKRAASTPSHNTGETPVLLWRATTAERIGSMPPWKRRAPARHAHEMDFGKTTQRILREVKP